MPRLSFVTLGAHDVPRLRTFYRDWGWTEVMADGEVFAAFDAGGVRLALYRADLLAAEAAPGEGVPSTRWNGVTLAMNVDRRDEVAAEVERALAAGAALVAGPSDRAWGGHSGYVADPEGTRWEVAWAPHP